MWFRRLYNTFLKFIVLVFTSLNDFKGCDAITNAEFNAQIRDYSVGDTNLNLSDVKTLQKQGLGLSSYANYAPVQHPVKFKDDDDSTISGSKHARGFLHHGHTGYAFDYEEPHFGHGYDYPVQGNHHDPHDYNHYNFHDLGHHHSPSHHHGYGYHKYYDNGLGHKGLLWPIAGLALLGAAAALVSNPVLLQLGVVSGKRRRRHIEDIENVAKNSIQKWTQITSDYKEDSNDIAQKVIKKRMLSKNNFKVDKQVLQSDQGDKLQFETVDNYPKRYSEEDRRFVPIPLKVRKP